MTPHQIGGKAANLRALQSVARVKPFVTITVPQVEVIRAGKPVPEEVRRCLNKLPKKVRYAVRSSGVNEDSLGHAWAGIFRSVLDVEHHEIESAMHDCIAALETPEALAYAKARGTSVGGLALIVQEMVDAECAGVLFTRNPVGSDGHMVIEAIAGNAELLVSGNADPARYYLSQEGKVVRKEQPNGFRLSPKHLRELFTHAVMIRQHFGGEQDIEWAYEGGVLYINQSRPITGLQELFADPATFAAGELNALISKERSRLIALGCRLTFDVFSDQNIAELLPRHPSPMAHGLFRYIFADKGGAIKTGRNAMGYDIGRELDAGFHVLIGGQPRVSIIHDAFTYRIRGIPFVDYLRMVEDYLWRIVDDESLANYPEVGLYQQTPTLDYLIRLFGPVKGRRYHEAYSKFLKGIRKLEEEFYGSRLRDFECKWRRRVATFLQRPPRNVAEGVRQYKKMCDLLRTDACRLFVQVARLGFFSYARVRSQLHERYGAEKGEAHLRTLMTGAQAMTGSTTSRTPNHKFTRALFELNAGGCDIDSVVREFGHLAEHELEISQPRYREQVSLLFGMSQKVETSVPNLEGRTEALILEEQLEEEMGAGWEQFSHDLDSARTYLVEREIVKFHYLMGYDMLRRISLYLEQRLGWGKGLIFYLDPKEVFELYTAPEKSHGIALLRREEHGRYRDLYVPPVVFSDRLAAIGRQSETSAGSQLRGIGVTNFVTEGECVIVKSIADKQTLAKIQPGSVLVTVNADPAWAAIIDSLAPKGALVTEVGGVLAHAATCAREVGIAAVLNVANATKALRTGMRVRVDGPAGVVEILSN